MRLLLPINRLRNDLFDFAFCEKSIGNSVVFRPKSVVMRLSSA